MYVVNREGNKVEFDSNRIRNAIDKALSSVGESKDRLDEITNEVIDKIDTGIDIESIQNIVEEILFKYYPNVARSYIIYRNKRSEVRHLSKDVNDVNYFDNNPLREFIFLRTYARWNGTRREKWNETIDRYINFMKGKLGDKLSNDEYNEVREYILMQKVVPSMRLLQFAGPAVERDNICAYNCAYTDIKCIDDLVEIMYISMCGTGVGWSVEDVSTFPNIKPLNGEVRNYVVDDSKEGWCDAFYILLSNLFDGIDSIFDYSKLRPTGSKLKTMGGRSSGPIALINLVEFTKNMFKGKDRLSTINIYDITCKIGEIVVSGGVRRTAMISFSRLDDNLMRDAKKGEFWNSNPQRFMTNNSVCYKSKPSNIDFMKEWLSLAESGTGERGIFNQGDIKLPERRKPEVLLSNPCSEILLRSKQFCNLSEVICRHNDSESDLMSKIKIATLIGTYQSTLTDFKYVSNKWKENQKEEALLGVSLTGIWDCEAVRNKDTLNRLREYSIEVNKEYSERFGINQSAAITAIKPSGCQVASTMLTTSKGILRLDEIGDINGKKWQKHDLNVSHSFGSAKSTKFYINGKVPTKKITMRSGMVLESSLNHKYKVFDIETKKMIWVEAKDLKEGDMLPYTLGDHLDHEFEYIKLKRATKPNSNCRDIRQPKYLNEDLAWFLGIYNGDGSNHKKGIRIAGNTNDLDGLKEAKRIVKEQFNIDAILYLNTKGSKANSSDLYINSTYLLEWLKVNNLLKNKSLYVEVPIKIRQSPTAVIGSYIDGYWEADGCLHKSGLRTWVTVSRKMADQMIVLLRAIGQDCSLRLMPPTKTSYGTNMRYWIAEVKGRSGNYCYSKYHREYIMLDEANLKHLNPDVIKSIEDGEEETYDIEVPKGNEYMANSYISHNTVSQLTDTSSGIHTRWSPYYIRRIRINNTDPLFKLMKDQGYKVLPEVGQNEDNATTWVLEFPVKAPEGSKFAKDLTAIEQLEFWKMFKINYTEHNPSITVYINKDEWLEAGKWIWDNWNIITGISFLPKSDHIYQLAPYEEITEEKYNEMVKSLPKVNFNKLVYYEKEDNTDVKKELACSGGKCEL